MMQAVLLGLVEGLTEFIPVSSTGHLIIFGEAIGFKGARASTFEVFIQLGAILAVVWLYWDRFLSFLNLRDDQNEDLRGRSGVQKLVVASIPAFISGYLLHGFIKEHLFSSMTVAIALIVGGVVLIVVERRETNVTTGSLDEITYKQSFIIGLFQCLALWPGVSRSGATIVGGLLNGLDRKVAAEFSFLLAVPVMLAATFYDLYKSWHVLSVSDLPIFAVGFIVSFISGALAIKFFISLLQRFTLEPFGYYRIVLGVLALALL